MSNPTPGTTAVAAPVRISPACTLPGSVTNPMVGAANTHGATYSTSRRNTREGCAGPDETARRLRNVSGSRTASAPATTPSTTCGTYAVTIGHGAHSAMSAAPSPPVANPADTNSPDLRGERLGAGLDLAWRAAHHRQVHLARLHQRHQLPSVVRHP